MSDALNYLVKTRPDALGHYFRFLKETGKYLDPKTRNLISVITKVDTQTERGFRQYLSRALREGCTPMEVLDALPTSCWASHRAGMTSQPPGAWWMARSSAWIAMAGACLSTATSAATAFTTAAVRTRVPTSRSLLYRAPR